MIPNSSPRGFTLLIAVILSSVVLAVGLALLDVSYKQLLLASSAKESQYAFYAADGALECALYYDQQFDLFNTNPKALDNLTGKDIMCGGQKVVAGSYSHTTDSGDGQTLITKFAISCPTDPTLSQANVTVYKNSPTLPANSLYAVGESSCDPTDIRRIERGLKVTY